MSYRIFLLLAALAAAGCRRASPPAYERIALPPFENLTGDPRRDWLSLGLAELLAGALTGAPRSQPLRVDQAAGAAALRATHILHGYFRPAGARLRADVVLEDLRTLRVVARASAEGDPEAGLAPLAERLAAALGRGAGSLPTRSTEALRRYAESFGAADPAAALEGSLAADPDFAAPYLSLAGLWVARGNAPAARAVLERALGRKGLRPPDRLRLELLAATLAGDAEARLVRLEALSRATPADAEVFRDLAALRLARGDYPGAVRDYRQALERDPGDPVLLNQAGYACAYAGDFAAGLAFLDRYRRLEPADPNPADSLGDLHFLFGRFAQAENFYLESVKKSPDFAGGLSWFKAAHARLMQGDREGADGLFEQYLRQRSQAGDPALELRRAEWDYLTGRSEQALRRLSEWAAAPDRQPDQRALALATAALWRLNGGDRTAARELAGRALSAAVSPSARTLARLCLFVAQPEASADEWAARAARTFSQAGQEPLRRSALAFALLLEGRFSQAAPWLEQLERQAPPPSQPARLLLAWALLETGRDPGRRLELWPIPEAHLGDPFRCLTFPRMLWLRAWWLERQGRREEARPLYRLYLKYAGPRAPAGERRRAEAALKP